MRAALVVAQRVEAPRSGYAMRTWTIATSLAGVGQLDIVDVGADQSGSGPDTVRLGADRIAAQHRIATGDIEGWMVAREFDVVVAAETALAPWVRGTVGARRIVSCQNVESELWRQHAARAAADERAAHTRRARSYELLERSVLPHVDQIWAASERDAEALAGRAPGLDIRVVPNVVVVHAAKDRRPEPGYGVFFGSLWHEPNQEAATELLGVSDELTRRGQAHRFSVVGAGAPDWLVDDIARRPAVSAEGFVGDLASVLAQAACVVLPATYGGGSMVKLIEALAAGCPVVTTPAGARGIPELVDGRHAIVRPLGAGFVDAVEAVLAAPDRYAEMGRHAADLMRERYSLDVLDALLAALLD